MQSEFVELLKCPITHKIFNNPVLGIDGLTYEDQLYNEEKVPCTSLKAFICAFLDNFPEYKEQQYVLLPVNNDHVNFKNIIENALNSRNYNKIKEYCNFSIKYLSHKALQNFLQYGSEDIIIYFIDNVSNVDDINDLAQWKLINYIFSCCTGKINILKHAINKGCSMASISLKDGWTPLHQVVYYSRIDECIIFAIDEHIKSGQTLYVETIDKRNIIYNIFSRCSRNVIEHALNNVDKTDDRFGNSINNFIDLIEKNTNVDIIDDKEVLIAMLFY